MRLEIDVNDESFDDVFIKIMKQQLEYTRMSIEKAKTGKLEGCYSWTDQQLELKELRRDEKAFVRMLQIYGVEK